MADGMRGEFTNPLCVFLNGKYFSLTAIRWQWNERLRSSTEIFFGKTYIFPSCRAYSLAKLNALMSTIMSLFSNIPTLLTSAQKFFCACSRKPTSNGMHR
ncbi:MAG: hypothetical protein HDR72_00215 [Ruminococcaceae bacterium]|nr:hypothetical protein [Oscillospiraceae bacterium]